MIDLSIFLCITRLAIPPFETERGPLWIDNPWNPLNIFMAYLQDIQMFFMSFSQCYFSGFPLVWYHEKFIKKAMKPPYTMNTRAKTMVKVWCWILMFLFYDDENPIIKQHKFKENVVGFPWHYKKLRVMKNVCFPPELGIIKGS